MPSTWIVIPTYNEKDNISEMISALFSLEIENLTVLIVDDNSPDKTADLVRELQAKYKESNQKIDLVVREKKAGLGPAYIHGFSHALENGADYIVQMDADFSHDPKDISRLLKEAAAGSDIVIGSRYIHGVRVINWALRRLLLSVAGNKYVRWVAGLPFTDSTGGFRAWRASALREIDLKNIRADGYGFQVVMLYLAWKKKMAIKEIPIIFTERREGQSKMTWKISLEAMWLVARLRILGK